MLRCNEPKYAFSCSYEKLDFQKWCIINLLDFTSYQLYYLTAKSNVSLILRLSDISQTFWTQKIWFLLYKKIWDFQPISSLCIMLFLPVKPGFLTNDSLIQLFLNSKGNNFKDIFSNRASGQHHFLCVWRSWRTKWSKKICLMNTIWQRMWPAIINV